MTEMSKTLNREGREMKMRMGEAELTRWNQLGFSRKFTHPSAGCQNQAAGEGGGAGRQGFLVEELAWGWLSKLGQWLEEQQSRQGQIMPKLLSY